MNKFEPLKIEKCAFFMCDIQEKFRNHISSFSSVIRTAKRMTDISKLLNIPLIVTEQYSKGLGNTVSELDIKNAKMVEDKTEFSMLTDKVKNFLKENNIQTVVIFGLEVHVCIYQTCLGLLSSGITVHLLVDASSSRSVFDGLVAIKQLQFMGVILSTCEIIAFQLIHDKKHDKFKEIQGLIKEIIPATDIMKHF